MQIFKTLITPNICNCTNPIHIHWRFPADNPPPPSPLPFFWPSHIALALKSKCSHPANDSHWLPLRKQKQDHESEGKPGPFLISPAPGCSRVLSCPDYLPLLQVCGLVLTFMTPLDNYLSSSDMSLEKSACCPVRCCSISSKCSRKLWHTVFMASISRTVHWEQLERAEKGVLSDSLGKLTSEGDGSPFPLGIKVLLLLYEEGNRETQALVSGSNWWM